MEVVTLLTYIGYPAKGEWLPSYLWVVTLLQVGGGGGYSAKGGGYPATIIMWLPC